MGYSEVLGGVAHRAEEPVGCSALRMMGIDVVHILDPVQLGQPGRRLERNKWN